MCALLFKERKRNEQILQKLYDVTPKEKGTYLAV